MIVNKRGYRQDNYNRVIQKSLLAYPHNPLHESQRLLSAPASQIKVGRLSKTTYPVSRPRLRVVIRRAMPRTPVIPNSQIVLLPLEPHLSVMILCHEVEQVW